MRQYQGIVALEGQGLEAAAHQYFRQSEQIPTKLRIAVGEVVIPGSTGKSHAWRGGGVLLQFLPSSPERQRQQEFDPGDAPPGTSKPEFDEDDAWIEARSLLETVEDHELLDPAVSSERLLYRLFHERGVRVFDPVTVREACRCSPERIREMLQGFSREDRQAMVADDGMIGVTCEFCSKHYSFKPSSFDPA
jgi:molecular chaperone Hsp33